MQQTILAISGKPGLYKLVSRGKNNLIVEALDATHRRMPDIPLMDVLENLKTVAEGKKATVDPKKASTKELQDYFTKVLPEWDRDRVHVSDIKKLISWYNILIEAGITDFKEEMQPTEGDNIDDRKEQE